MKRRKLANGIMVLLILVIGAAGVLTAGFIRGWFDRDTEAATLTGASGRRHHEARRRGLPGGAQYHPSPGRCACDVPPCNCMHSNWRKLPGPQ